MRPAMDYDRKREFFSPIQLAIQGLHLLAAKLLLPIEVHAYLTYGHITGCIGKVRLHNIEL